MKPLWSNPTILYVGRPIIKLLKHCFLSVWVYLEHLRWVRNWNRIFKMLIFAKFRASFFQICVLIGNLIVLNVGTSGSLLLFSFTLFKFTVKSTPVWTFTFFKDFSIVAFETFLCYLTFLAVDIFFYSNIWIWGNSGRIFVFQHIPIEEMAQLLFIY